MKRIFIALKVEAGETLRNVITSLKTGLIDESIRWTNHDNIHITLVFLGDTDEKIVTDLCAMLRNKCERSGQFELIIRGTGVFKNLADPHVVWTGIDPSEALARLNSNIVQGIRETGIEIEERPFRPHLTLGRIKHIKDREGLKSLLAKFQNAEIQKVPVNEVILYESILQKSGPVYKPVCRCKL